MVATLMREYVKKNEQWLGNGDYISMGNDMNPDCKGTCLIIPKMAEYDHDGENYGPNMFKIITFGQMSQK